MCGSFATDLAPVRRIHRCDHQGSEITELSTKKKLAELDTEGEKLCLGAYYLGQLDPMILDFSALLGQVWVMAELGLLHLVSIGFSKILFFNKSKTNTLNK